MSVFKQKVPSLAPFVDWMGKRPRNARLGNTWKDRAWRRSVSRSLATPLAVPFGSTDHLAAIPGPEPRAGWTSKTDSGGVWAQPMRGFS